MLSLLDKVQNGLKSLVTKGQVFTDNLSHLNREQDLLISN